MATPVTEAVELSPTQLGAVPTLAAPDRARGRAWGRARVATLARRAAPLLLAATGWLAVYRLNGPLWDAVVYDAAGLDPSSRLGSGLHFFCYDTVKIALLLTGIIFVVTVLRSFVTLERTRALLGGRRAGRGQCGRRRPRRRHPVLLVLGGAGLHRLRRRRRADRGDPVVPDRQPAGQRGRRRAALRPVRLQDRRPVRGVRAAHRDRRRVGARPAARRTLGGAVRLPDHPARKAGRARPGAELVRPDGAGPRRGRHHPPQDLAVPAGRASASAHSSTAGPPRTSSPATPARTTRWPRWWPSGWGCRCTPTPPACCPSCRRCRPKASRWAPCWRS